VVVSKTGGTRLQKRWGQHENRSQKTDPTSTCRKAGKTIGTRCEA